MTRKIIAIWLIVTMLAGLLPSMAFADESSDVETLTVETSSADVSDAAAVSEDDFSDVAADDSSEENAAKENSVPTESSDAATDSEADFSVAEADDSSEAGPTSTEVTDTDSTVEDTDHFDFNILAEENIQLQYDDTFDLTERFPGYSVCEIQTETVTSYVVSGGSCTSQLDTEVIRLDAAQTGVTAVGVGKASVFMTNDDARNNTESETDAIKVNITVAPATLTIIFMAGQSNIEGFVPKDSAYQPQYSVECSRGQVYSTYSARDTEAAQNITGLSAYYGGTVSNADSIVAGALGTNNTAIDGSELIYPLYALTEDGNGKTGPDGAIAYKWNNLTGDKVWCVNAGWGGARIAYWVPGAKAYNKAEAVFSAADRTYQAEIQSGHYVAGQKLMFWMQGESDPNTAAETYYSSFIAMYNGLQSLLSIDYWGIIAARAATGVNAEELYMTAPRQVQYFLAASKELGNLYMVSNVNEQWTTDTGTSAYFCSKYPNGYVDYPVHIEGSLPILTTAAAIHANDHFTQLGHNENGLDAAYNMYNIISGSTTSITAVKWVDACGNALSSGNVMIDGQIVPTSIISADAGENIEISFMAEPTVQAKNITLEYDRDVLERDEYTGIFRSYQNGEVTVLAKDSSGKILAALRISAEIHLSTPTLTSIANTGSGLRLTWTGNTVQGFMVFRKSGSSGWRLIAKTDRSIKFYTDESVTDGISYTYTVKAYCGTTYSGYNTSGITGVMLRTPHMTDAIYTSSGIMVKWNSVKGAQSYNIYRRTEEGSWSRLGSATGLSYTDTTAKNGVSYIYTARAVNNGKLSSFEADGINGIRTATPVLVSTANTYDGIKVTWCKVTGAEEYNIYRKTNGGNWELLGSTTDNVLEDKSVKENVTYIYTVRSVNGGRNSSGFDSTGKTCIRILQPVLLAAAGYGSQIKVTWNAVKGAKSYNVYRRPIDGLWSKIANTSTCYYFDTQVVESTWYIYTVRAVIGSSISSFDAGIAGIRVPTPELESAQKGDSSIFVTWQSVDGADAYRVYRRVNNGSWTLMGDTPEMFWNDEDITLGNKYTYTVRALIGENLSGFDSNGVSATA